MQGLGAKAAATQPKHTLKTLRNALLIGLTVFVISRALAEDSETVKNDRAELQGQWSMVSSSADGQPMPESLRQQMKRVCKGDEVITTMSGQVYFKAKTTIDALPKPKTIDYQMTEGVTQGKTQLGIYELAGDTFKACFSAPGDPRPTDFTTKPGDRKTLSVWKRETQPVLAPEQK